MSDELELSIHIQASPETVFRFLSDPVLFQQWMGPGATLGADRVTVAYPTGQVAQGTLRESTPHRRIVFGWGYVDGTHGLAPDASTVTIELTPAGDGTQVTLRHSGLNAAQRSEHLKGWTHYLAQLAGAATNLLFAESLPAATQNYVAAWNETDVAARQQLLDACWEETGFFRDSMGVADGRIALLHYISGAQQFVPGFRLELTGTPEQCHGYYRFSWQIRMPDGNTMGRGTNFGQLTPAGRFASAIGFWDK